MSIWGPKFRYLFKNSWIFYNYWGFNYLYFSLDIFTVINKNKLNTKKINCQKKLTKIFKPWIVKRPNGGCQVLFPLSELDTIVEKILKE